MFYYYRHLLFILFLLFVFFVAGVFFSKKIRPVVLLTIIGITLAFVVFQTIKFLHMGRELGIYGDTFK